VGLVNEYDREVVGSNNPGDDGKEAMNFCNPKNMNFVSLVTSTPTIGAMEDHVMVQSPSSPRLQFWAMVSAAA